jgi:aminoglycoside 3-N-acetyltransferase
MSADAGIFRAVLDQAGVSNESLLVVHSAIGVLSRQGFRANEIIEVFLDRVHGGGLFMPTMTWRSVTPAQPNWDEVGTPSHTGVLTEIFRTQYAAARSIHPTHSVSGWGRDAPKLLSRHHIDDTPVSSNSPYALMRDYDTFVLTIGVGLETVTAIHYPEEIINEELYVLPRDSGVIYPCRDRNGTTHQVRARRHRRLDRDFPRFEAPLAAKGQLQVHEIAGCRCLIFPLNALLREVFGALMEDPRATLNARAVTGPSD